MTDAADTLDDGKLTVHHDFVWLLHRNGLDTFESYYDEKLGRLLRDVGPRANVRLTLDAAGRPRTFYLKRHEPLRFVEKLRAWLCCRRPRTAARTEWDNIGRLARLGIATSQPVTLGEDPLTGRSFLMTAEIDSAVPADDFVREHFVSRDTAVVRNRRRFVRRLARLIRKLHNARMTHRDLYLCHVFVRRIGEEYRLHLIDLQRLGGHVFRRRWRVKDLAQLEFSRPPEVFSLTDVVRFLRTYFDVDRLGSREKCFVRSVRRKVRRMRQRAVRETS